MAEPVNRLMSQGRKVEPPPMPAPKPIHNELWSVRSLANQKLAEARSGNAPVFLEAAEARLLLGTLVSLIGNGQAKIEEMQTAAKTGLLQAMKATTDRLSPAEE
jgi:hypothetical protein